MDKSSLTKFSRLEMSNNYSVKHYLLNCWQSVAFI